MWTRDAASGGDPAGRPRLITAMCAGALKDARHLYLRQAFSCGAFQLLLILLRFCWGLLTLRPEPLQCLLFAAPSEVRRMVREVRASGAGVVYLDGIRCVAVARRLHALGLPLVVDYHDLMFRRCELQLAAGTGANVGYLGGSLPRWVVWLINRCGRLILAYERLALRRAEGEMVGLSRSVVLLSHHEADALRAVVGPELAKRVLCIPPLQALVAAPPAFTAPYRFIFVGGERLTQNRLTLVRLAALWRAFTPARPLHWFGRRMSEQAPVPPGIVSHGFVDDLVAAAYDGHSILLIPSGLGGGVKTKILEALAHGCPVVGNDIAFQGLGWDDYPLVLDDDAAWERMMDDPEAQAALLELALARGRAWLVREHEPAVFDRRWRVLLGLGPEPPAASA